MDAQIEPTGPIVKFVDVHKTFGSNKVLRGLDLEIPRSKITYVIGRSGEGKSVTIKHIVGIIKPDAGEVIVDGTVMNQSTHEQILQVRKKIGLLFQDGCLFDSLSVAENVAFSLREYSKMSLSELNARVDELLELVGLPGYADKMTPELSIGERKRVGLARALALNPSLLLYDEPTTGMDSLISELIDDLVISMQSKIKGLSSVVISHDIRSVLHVAEHVIFLHEGKVYAQGSPDTFRQSHDPLIKQFLTGSATGPLSKPIA